MQGNSLKDAENIEYVKYIFKKHESFIRAMVRKFSHTTDSAEDFYQDLFVYFCRKGISRDINNMEGFLYRVIYGRSKDLARYDFRQRALFSNYAQYYQQLHSSYEEYEIDENENEQLFDRINKYVTKNEARAIFYRCKQGFSLAEAAEKMGVLPKTITRYVSSGLRKIREKKMKERADE